jgi:hypothetical protein
MSIPNFTLTSIELSSPIVHKCRILQRVNDGGIPDKLLVAIDPPASGAIYRYNGDPTRVVLAPRRVSVTIYPHVSEWPCHVHICIPRAEAAWTTGPFEIAD